MNTIGLFLLSASALAHGDFHAENVVDCMNYPTIMSYHVHITYMLTNKAQIVRTRALQAEAAKEFAPLMDLDSKCQGTEKDPSGRYDNGKLCMIYDHDLAITLGPFPVGEWSMFVPVAYYSRVVPWFLQHRGEFSLLVHPNTGCEYEDHLDWALWAGEKWPLDSSIFTQG